MPEQDLDARTRLTEALFNDPETRPLIEQAIKQKFPQVRIPAQDVRDEGAKTLAEIRAEREKLEADRRAMEGITAREDARRKIMLDPDLRIQPEEIAAVEALMTEKLIGTHETAAKMYRLEQAATIGRPRSGEPATLEIPGVGGAGGDEFKGITEDPDKWARNRAREIANDFAAGKEARWL